MSVERDRAGHLAAIEAAVGRVRAGLPEDVFRFVSRLTPLVNVDLLIQDDRGRTLLTWRDDEFFGAGWHVPGGIIRYKETAADRIRACAREELGADVSFELAPLLVAETIRQDATRGHFISLLFRCRLGSPLDEAKRAGAPLRPGDWQWHERSPRRSAGCPAPVRAVLLMAAAPKPAGVRAISLIVAAALAAGLLWLSLRGIDWREVGHIVGECLARACSPWRRQLPALRSSSVRSVGVCC